jgi:hypothetical protein
MRREIHMKQARRRQRAACDYDRVLFWDGLIFYHILTDNNKSNSPEREQLQFITKCPILFRQCHSHTHLSDQNLIIYVFSMPKPICEVSPRKERESVVRKHLSGESEISTLILVPLPGTCSCIMFGARCII